MSSSVPVTYDNRTGAVATTHDAPTGVDRNNTSLLARYITTDIHPDDMCPEHDSDPYYYGYDWPVCTCERLGNKRLMCTQLILAIPGNPVREKPSECVYTLRVMRHHTTQTDFRESILDISSAEVEFSIAAQIDDPTTMPHDHQEMVTKYTQSLTQPTIFTSFEGATAASIYVHSFESLCNNIRQRARKVIVPNPNAHKTRGGGGVRLKDVAAGGGGRELKTNPHVGKKGKGKG